MRFVYTKIVCDACEDELLIGAHPDNEPKGWHYSETFGELCPACVSKLKMFMRNFYIEGSGDCIRMLKLIDDGI